MYAIEAAPGPGRASMAGDPSQTMQRQINYRAAGYEYDTEVSVDPAELAKALDTFAKGARRLVAPTEDQEDATQALRTKLADWADGKKDIAGKLQDLRTEKGVELLGQVRQESNAHAQPASADLIETLQVALNDLRRPAKTAPIPHPSGVARVGGVLSIRHEAPHSLWRLRWFIPD